MSNFTCDDILRLIRASKTFNLNFIKVGDLVISRSYDVATPIESTEPDISEVTKEVGYTTNTQIAEELASFEQENLLINDPVEYERRVGNQ